MNPISEIASEKLAIIHRQWIRSDRLRIAFDEALSRTEASTASDPSRFYVSDAGVFMVVWYSMLFSVLEWLVKEHVNVSSLDVHYSELHDALRQLRNSVFHAEKEYWDPRQKNLFAIADSAQRIRHIHDELGMHFQRALTS